MSEQVDRILEAISTALNDRKSAASNRTRAYNIWHSSGLPEDVFIDLLIEARGRAQSHGNITKRNEASIDVVTGKPLRTAVNAPPNRGPYFFTVLQNLVKEEVERRPPHTQPSDTYAWQMLAHDGLDADSGLKAMWMTAVVADDGVVRLREPTNLPPGRYRAIVVIAGAAEN